MKTVGELLSEARIKKEVTLGEAEAATKIRKKNLEALEQSDWGSLPPTVIKGLLRNYASYLGLDEKRIIAFFRREYDEKKATNLSLPTKVGRGLRITPALVSVLLVGLAVAVVTGYLYSQYHSFTAPPKLEIQEPNNNIKVSSKEVNVVGQTWSDAQVQINGEKVQVSQSGVFSIQVGLKEGVNVLVITSSNRFGKVSTEKRTVVVEGPQVADQVLSEQAKSFQLKLTIDKKPTFVSVDIDGKNVFNGLMVEGNATTFEAKERIKIHTENAGNTKVNIGSQEIVLGKDGEVVDKEFTP